MTPTQLELAVRNKYNAVGDSFWSQDEILNLLYQACLDMATECLVIESTYTTSTVAAQQEYTYPSNTIAIKRITYEGIPLTKRTFTEDDVLTAFNAASLTSGTPNYYFIWNDVIYLRNIPDAVGTLKIFTYNEPSTISIGSTVEIPSMFHMDLVDYAASELAAKDSNPNMAKYYLNKWEKAIVKAKRWSAKKKRTDKFSVVQTDEVIL